MVTYIHYGELDHYDENLFNPIRNEPDFVKPIGGLWACDVKQSLYTGGHENWKEFVLSEEMHKNIENSFMFKLSKNANILHIRSLEDLKNLPKQETVIRSNVILDFEKMLSDGIDAIYVYPDNSYELRWALYGWDINSILVMNKDIIEPI